MPLPLSSADFDGPYLDAPWVLRYGEAFERLIEFREDDQVAYDVTGCTIEVELLLELGAAPFSTFGAVIQNQLANTGEVDIQKAQADIEVLNPGQTFGYVRMYVTLPDSVMRTLWLEADALFKDFPANQVGGV